MPLNNVCCGEIVNPVPLSVNDLAEAGIPPRFWHPTSNPFDVFPTPLEWWNERYTNSKAGKGLLVLADPKSFVELGSAVELLKRLLCDGDRPSLAGALNSSCYCIRATDCLRNVADWDKLLSIGFLLVTGIGVGLSERLEGYLCDLFRARYEVGAVTFFHIVERPGDKEYLARVLNMIPEGSY